MSKAMKLAALALVVAAGCGDIADAGPSVTVDVAALNLVGVGDVVWDIEVRNGATTPEVVWQRRLSSSRYGDGAGSASYVGTCDADANDNTVRVWVVGVYAGAVTDAGVFSEGAASGVGAVTGVPLEFQSPTATAPLERTVTCRQDADVAVQFDVTLMRPAQQGFFDVAVSFNDVFCSAKFDCCEDANNDGCGAGEDIALLFTPGRIRGRTMVLGFACTAGTAPGDATTLYMDALALDCTSPGDGFDADFTIDLDGAVAGNQCVAGDVSGCDVVHELGAVVADDYLFQVAVYRGAEALTNDGASAHKTYWNVALGVTASVGACELRTRATADNPDDAFDGMSDGVVSAGAVYPYVSWAVPLGACASEELTFGGSGPVRTQYTAASPTAPDSFDYGFAPGLPPAPVCADGCVNGTCTAPDTCTCTPGYEGPTCAVNHDDCAPDPCLNGGTCSDGVDSFSCACAAGYEGPTCAVNHDDCAPDPCLHGGTCSDGVDSFSCACTAGYTGAVCEIPLSDPVKLSLSGGNFDRATTYTAPNGTTVTSSAATYVNSSYYYLAYLFNGTYGTAANNYWLTSSGGGVTLTFTFNQPYTFDYVRVYPTAISDRKSNYTLDAWNGATWVNITGGLVVTTSDPVGTYRDHAHAALTNVTRLRFTLTREQNWGVTLNEVEFYWRP